MGSEGQIFYCVGVSQGWCLAGSGQSLLLEGVVLIALWGCFAFGLFCLSRDKLGRRTQLEKSEVKGSGPSPLLGLLQLLERSSFVLPLFLQPASWM